MALALAWPSPARSAPAADSSYLAELVGEARTRGLAGARGWNVLLHYRSGGPGRGLVSLADSPDFFRAPTGRTDPAAELEATLAAFFAPPAPDEPDRHPQCELRGRFTWLGGELGFDGARLPERPCPAFDQWQRDLGAAALTLVFAEAYMNNPASLFGHTLLRIDPTPPDTEEERRDLLAYAVNFAAESGGEGGPLFAVKGLTGGYPGFFSLEPYYDKVKRYGDWESRNLWEYRLDLRPDEVDRLLRHLWELRDVAFDYYFFTENCSYELLGLLEVARPSVDLRGQFPAWVIPVDTVRAVLDQEGLLRDVSWRPSASTRLRHLAEQLAPQERRLARAVADGSVDAEDERLARLPDATRALVLTLAHDHLRLRASSQEERATKRRSLRILTARSRVPTRGEPPLPARPATRPDEGHGTARLVVGAGARDGDAFLEARLRPAFHDILDRQGGYVDGAQIDFMEAALRWYPEDDALRLHELTVVDILSVAPRDEFFEPIAWKFRTGLESGLLPRGSDRDELRDGRLWRSAGGAGLAARPTDASLAYVFLEGTADVSDRLQPGFALGAGASVGLVLGEVEDPWRTQLRAGATGFVAGDTRMAWSVGASERLALGRDHALVLDLGLEHDFGETWLEAGLFLRRTF